jgi:hypothetical protein
VGRVIKRGNARPMDRPGPHHKEREERDAACSGR